jgi:hypothetical protein
MENKVSTLQSQLGKERELKDMIEREFFSSKQVSEDLEKKIGDQDEELEEITAKYEQEQRGKADIEMILDFTQKEASSN